MLCTFILFKQGIINFILVELGKRHRENCIAVPEFVVQKFCLKYAAIDNPNFPPEMLNEEMKVKLAAVVKIKDGGRHVLNSFQELLNTIIAPIIPAFNPVIYSNAKGFWNAILLEWIGFKITRCKSPNLFPCPHFGSTPALLAFALIGGKLLFHVEAFNLFRVAQISTILFDADNFQHFKIIFLRFAGRLRSGKC